jgi:hypothetical protein
MTMANPSLNGSDMSLADELEFIGQLQSIAMDVACYHPDFTGLPREQIYAIIRNFICRETQAELSIPPLSALMKELEQIADKDAEELTSLLLEKKFVTENQAAEILRIMEEVEDADSDDPDEMAESATENEHKIAATRGFSEEEKEIIIGASITSKHLFTYWWDAGQNPMHPIKDISPDNGLSDELLSAIVLAGVYGFVRVSEGNATKLESGVCGAALFAFMRMLESSGR